MEMIYTALKPCFACPSDFEKLKPFMQANCSKLGLEWSNYEAIANRILAEPSLGKFIYVEQSQGEVLGFLMVTSEFN